jgi:hypothetical protein
VEKEMSASNHLWRLHGLSDCRWSMEDAFCAGGIATPPLIPLRRHLCRLRRSIRRH